MPSAVRIGGVDTLELRQDLRTHKVQLNRAADMLFEDSRFVPLGQSQVVEIATLSVAELGFAKGTTYGQLTARALELGLAECPLELGRLSEPERDDDVHHHRHRLTPTHRRPEDSFRRRLQRFVVKSETVAVKRLGDRATADAARGEDQA